MPQYTEIDGVRHTIVPADTINYHQADKRIENHHPAGDVFVVGKYGYVQSGYGWLRFAIGKLDQFPPQGEVIVSSPKEWHKSKQLKEAVYELVKRYRNPPRDLCVVSGILNPEETWLQDRICEIIDKAKPKTYADRVIAAAMTMDEIFHDWQANFNPDDALLFVKNCEVYNRMRREGMVSLIDYINKAMPKIDLGEDNPNTGHSCHEYRIGNEGSRVIYVMINLNRVPSFRPTTKDEVDHMGKLFAKIEKHAKTHANVDEITLIPEGGGRWTIRLWWD